MGKTLPKRFTLAERSATQRELWQVCKRCRMSHRGEHTDNPGRQPSTGPCPRNHNPLRMSIKSNAKGTFRYCLDCVRERRYAATHASG